MERIRILVVEDDPVKRMEIIHILSGIDYIKVVGEGESAEGLQEILEETGPDVVLLQAHLPGDGYRIAEKIALFYPWIGVIILEKELKEEAMRRAIFAGARDVLLYPFSPQKLVDSIYRVFQQEKTKRSLQQEKNSAPLSLKRQGLVLTVFSTKGGVGKTFLAANLAVSIAQSKKKVVLVDLDLHYGGAALALNIVPRYTIGDVVNDLHNLDRDLLESYLLAHQSGLRLLAAGPPPGSGDFISAKHTEMIIKALQEFFDYIVVDMPGRLSETEAPALQQADLLLLLMVQEIAAIRNIKACMAHLQGLNYPQHKMKLVLNKAEPRHEIRFKDVETTLKQRLFSIIPAEHKLATSSLNKGIPVVQLYPRAKISRGIRTLARQIMGNGAEQRTKAAVPAAAIWEGER